VPPLAAAGYDPATVYYFGESVLRATSAAAAWATASSTSARPSPGPAATAPPRSARSIARPITRARPADYVPLDRFWGKRGFVRRPDIVGQFAWKDLDAEAETAKPMVFWTKALA
jgi:hypothetical protein